MTRTQFRKYRRQLRKEADGVATAKSRDYAGLYDVCANFREAARNLGLTKYQIWAVYADKGLSAIRNGIRANPQSPEVASEPLRGRIIDAINYLQLLGAMLEEDQMASTAVIVSGPRLFPESPSPALQTNMGRDGST